MKITSRPVIHTFIEMTREECNQLFKEYRGYNNPANPNVCGKRLIHWCYDDGDNCILLEGESVYSDIDIIKNT